MPAIHDVLSQTAIVMVILVNLFVLVIAVSFDPWFMPLFLLIGAVVLRVYVNRRKVKVDKKISGRDANKIAWYSILGLAGLAIIGVISQNAFVQVPALAVSTFGLNSPIVYSGIMAISETQYFHGEMQSYLMRYGIGVVITSMFALGLIFHQRVYDSSPSDLLFAGLGFALLAWVTWKTGRILVTMTVHFTNNVMSILLGPFIVLALATVLVATYVISTKKAKFWRSIKFGRRIL